jgi:hypothetical protein
MHDLGLAREADGSEKRVCLLLNPSSAAVTATNDVKVFCG